MPVWTMALTADASFVASFTPEEVAEGEQRVIVGRDARVLICWDDKRLMAVAELCPHALQPLLGGKVADGQITCPRHGACFDLVTGQAMNRVTTALLPIFEIREKGGRIEVWSNASTKAARVEARKPAF